MRAPAWHRLRLRKRCKSLLLSSVAGLSKYTALSSTAWASPTLPAIESSLRSPNNGKALPRRVSVVITRITGEACGFPFEEKKEYLVYVVTEPKDIQTGICTGTKNIAEAEEEMKQLDKLLQTNRKNRDSPAANHAT